MSNLCHKNLCKWTVLVKLLTENALEMLHDSALHKSIIDIENVVMFFE